MGVLLRLAFLSVPLITDEAGYAYVAHWMARGLALYTDLWFDRPQGIFLVYGMQMAVLGESTEAIRLGAALYNGVTTVLVHALGRTLATPRVGLASAGLFALASASPAIEGFTANGELYMNLPVVACLLLAAHGRWTWSGVALALAVAVKPTAVLSAGPALAVLLLWARRPATVLRRCVLVAAGLVVGVAPFVAHGVATDAALYWYSVVGFRVQAHSALSVGGALVRDLLQTAPTVTAALLPLWVLVAIGGYAGGWTRAGVAGMALLGGAVAGAALGGYWYWHYYVGLVPGAALLGALGMAWVLDRRHRALAAVLLLATLVAVGFNARLVGTARETSWRLYGRPAYLQSSAIADYVRARTGEQDTIYAAFAQADLYHLSGRRSAGRHLYWTEINRAPGALEAVIEMLDDPARRPAYVIEIERELEVPGRSAAFWERVERYYMPEREIGGFMLYRRRENGA
ncbi:MAG: hypothetical protein AVDCRST_MAG77-4560 [uncultured Chloroflexi bacterium]|uniref:Glycosyltransferase RgtA/B/C/D-like domain-containing protein n=1 Tax=uncultured Chloroflexota bacterium TaxID=166587 RepID=A0A6J4JVV1_9CHLR|nr:MAG: hypothetical protein AVDCRST_MAG77-4560 [uncultured Chloroflexota bacterium]